MKGKKMGSKDEQREIRKADLKSSLLSPTFESET